MSYMAGQGNDGAKQVEEGRRKASVDEERGREEGKRRVSETRIESIKTLMLGPGGILGGKGINTSSIGCRRKGEG